MEEVVIKFIKKPKLRSPVLIEGLPGVGNVGKLAAEHLIDQLKAVKFADIYSKHFPPQVLVNDDGVIRLVNNELYYKKLPKSESDLIFYVGDYQGLTPEGQYMLSSKVLDICEEFKVSRIYTLGGYGMGKMIQDTRVLGAATSNELVEEMKGAGVVFPKGEPGSGIVGASGLLLGLGNLRGLEAVCLMGETSGYFADPKGAQAVLEILTELINVKVDFQDLVDKADQIDAIASKLKDLEETAQAGGGMPTPNPDDLHYIG